MNITHESPEYKKLWDKLGKSKYNGCWYYSQEIVKNIIPNVQTKREWNTVGRDFKGMHDGMIVFLHDNATPWHYKWLQNYNDLVLVCSSQYTADSVKYWGETIILPMSIDVEYVKQFSVPEKTKDTCFVGNEWVKQNIRSVTYQPDILDNVDVLSSLPREKLLRELAKYAKAYAIDRCALEALTLGCELLNVECTYGCDKVDRVIDNREAAQMLQEKLNKIDGGKHGE